MQVKIDPNVVRERETILIRALWRDVEARKSTVAMEHTNGGQAGHQEPTSTVLRLQVIRKAVPLQLTCLLQDSGKREVTRRPVDGDEARGVRDTEVRIYARINGRRRARVRRVRSSLRRSSAVWHLRRYHSVHTCRESF